MSTFMQSSLSFFLIKNPNILKYDQSFQTKIYYFLIIILLD